MPGSVEAHGAVQRAATISEGGQRAGIRVPRVPAGVPELSENEKYKQSFKVKPKNAYLILKVIKVFEQTNTKLNTDD